MTENFSHRSGGWIDSHGLRQLESCGFAGGMESFPVSDSTEVLVQLVALLNVQHRPVATCGRTDYDAPIEDLWVRCEPNDFAILVEGATAALAAMAAHGYINRTPPPSAIIWLDEIPLPARNTTPGRWIVQCSQCVGLARYSPTQPEARMNALGHGQVAHDGHYVLDHAAKHQEPPT